MTSPTIRRAHISDLWGISQTLISLAKDSKGFYPDPDLAWASHRMIDAIEANHVAVADYPDKTIVGVIALDLSHFQWTHPGNPKGHYYSTEHFWVAPGHRRGGTAKRLLEWAERRADADGLRLHVQMFTPDDTTHLKDRFVANQGFDYLGGNFIRTPRPPSSQSSAPQPISAGEKFVETTDG